MRDTLDELLRISSVKIAAFEKHSGFLEIDSNPPRRNYCSTILPSVQQKYVQSNAPQTQPALSSAVAGDCGLHGG